MDEEYDVVISVAVCKRSHWVNISKCEFTMRGELTVLVDGDVAATAQGMYELALFRAMAAVKMEQAAEEAPCAAS